VNYLAHHDVGHDVSRVTRTEPESGLGVERPDQVARHVQVGVRAPEELVEPDELARGERREVVADELERDRQPGRPRRQRLELEQQALLQRACADAGRLERLHEPQRRGKILRLDLVLGQHQRRQLVEAELQVAVVVECVDHEVRERAIALPHLRQQQLPPQVVPQGELRLRPFGQSVWS
jgi:hypothetical protein